MQNSQNEKTIEEWCEIDLQGWYLNELLNTDEYEADSTYRITKKEVE